MVPRVFPCFVTVWTAPHGTPDHLSLPHIPHKVGSRIETTRIQIRTGDNTPGHARVELERRKPLDNG